MIPDVHYVDGIAPINGGSARSGDWGSLKYYQHVTIVVQIAMGNAATTAITVDKAKTAAGGSNSDGISITNWWKVAGVAGASDTYTKGAAATSITSAATGSGREVFVLEFDAAELGDDYDFIQVELGASSASNIVSALYIFSSPRYPASHDTAMTAIA